jgi:hypothetical protein
MAVLRAVVLRMQFSGTRRPQGYDRDHMTGTRA